MAAPVGAEVGLYMDTPRTIVRGDEIRTQTGRRYLVLAVRRQMRGKHTGRWHLRCEILAADAQLEDPDAMVHPIRWYSR